MIIAAMLAAGFLLDALFGDPRWLPHLVVGIGKLISVLERVLRRVFPKTPGGERAGGIALVFLVAVASFFFPLFVNYPAYRLNPWVGFVLETFVCFQALAAKSLADAARLVYDALKTGDIDKAREAVGRIVGRDVRSLDASGVARAAVETVAENSSDGVVAPMLYFAIGGAPLAILYKAVNTMDSMLGYKNEKYLHFGAAAARLDDAANFPPARLTAFLMIPAAWLSRLDWRGAWKIWRRDGGNHASPNAGHPEAACAGALGIRLGGASVYGGRSIEKPTIGDATRDIVPEDIVRANRLLGRTAALCLAAGVVIALLLHTR